MITVGIIGFGSFGKFLADKLDPHAKVLVSSRQSDLVPDKWRSEFANVAECDYVILSIPLDAYEKVLHQLKPLLRSNTVIVDVCSVKVKPVQIIKSVIPDVKLVATHPLFGPESAAKSLAGHTFVMCNDVSSTDEAKTIRLFAKSIGLDVVEKTADEHDREMATVHALTFFIAQALVNINISDASLHTPSFKKLLSLAELERHHSEELFKTIQSGNLHASFIRQSFINEIIKLNDGLIDSK